MKSRQVTALLLSVIMTVSACMPMNGISAFAAENSGAANTETAAVQEPEGEEQEVEAAAESAGEAEEVTEQPAEQEQVEEPAEQEEVTEEPAEEEEEPAEEAEEPAEEAQEPAEEAQKPAEEAEEPEEEAQEPAEETEAVQTEVAEEASSGKSAEQEEVIADETIEIETSKEAKNASDPTDDDFASAETIEIEETKTVNLVSEMPYKMFKFVPEEDGKYAVEVKSESICVFSDAFKDDKTYNSNYDSEPFSDGYYFYYELEAGKTYYFRVISYYEESGSATLYVRKALDVTTESADISCEYGQEYELSISAKSDNPISYQWTYKDEIIGTESVLHFTPTQKCTIDCEISDGNDTVKRYFNLCANGFDVRLYGGCEEYNRDNYYYITAEAGDTVNLDFWYSANDESKIEIQWAKKDGDVYRVIDGVTTGFYTTEELSGGESYKFSISDGYGNDVEIIVDIRVENNLVVSPENGDEWTVSQSTVAYGSTQTFNVSVSADDTSRVTYKWVKKTDGVEEVIEGATSSSYTTDNLYDNGEYLHYICYVNDGYGNTDNAEFEVYVEQPPYYLFIDAEEYYVSIYPDEDSWPTLRVNTSTNDISKVSYQWYCNDEIISGATSSEYELNSSSKVGQYKCVAKYDQFDHLTDSTEIEVSIYNNLSLSTVNGSFITVDQGEQAELEVEVSANDPTDLRYEWKEWIGDEDHVIDGATGSKYTTPAVYGYHEYSCTVYDRYGNDEIVYFQVAIYNDLRVYPTGNDEYDTYKSVIVNPGDPLKLQVTADANDTSQLKYYWSYPGVEEAVEGSDTLEIASAEQSGNYECRVEDQYGNRENCYFEVTIDNNFKAFALENGETDCIVKVPYGESAKLEVSVSADVTDGITYTWYYNDEADVIDENILTTSPINGYRGYECYVTDKYGNYKSVFFYVYVDNQLTACAEGYGDGETAYIYGESGEEVELNVQISALDTENLDVYWDSYYVSGFEGTYDSATGKASAKANIKDGYDYFCRIRDKYDNEKTVVFETRVNDHFSAYPEGAGPDENGNYKKYVDLYPSANKKLNLRVIASNDSGKLDYYWSVQEKYPTTWGEYDTDYNGLDQNSESISITADTAKVYRCVVEDDYYNSEEIYFYIHMGGVSAYPVDPATGAAAENSRVAISAEQGKEITLKVNATATGDSKLTYKWTDGPLSDSGWWSLENGSTTDSLTVTANESRRYLCVVTDQYENQSLCYFYVNINGMKLSSNMGTPVLEGDNKYSLDVTVDPKEEITLQTIVTAASTEGISYAWKERIWDEYSMGSGDSYTFIPEDLEDDTLTCEVTYKNSDEGEDQKAWITYHLIMDNQLTVTPVGLNGPEAGKTAINVSASKNTTVKLSVDVSASDNTNLGYEWFDPQGRTCSTAASYNLKVTGDGTYRCTVYDKYRNEKTVYFHIITGEVSITKAQITLASQSVAYNGAAMTPAVTVKYNETALTAGKDYKVRYENNINVGTAKVYVTGLGNYARTKCLTFTIIKGTQPMKASLSAAKIAVGKTTKVTVSGVKESAKVTYKSSNTAVATVSAAGVVTAKKVGTAKITATTAATKSYNATSKQVTVSVLPGATTKVTAVAATNGKGIKLTWTKVAGATQYQVYRNNKLIKTTGNVATYTDTGANTNGTKYTFKIVAKASTGVSTLSKSAVYYKVNRPAVKKLTNSASKKMTVKWAKNAKATGYEIQYGLKKNFKGAKTVKVTKKATVSKTISKLTKSKTYYVRIRTYKKVGKVTYYSAWSASKSIKIKK